MNCTKRDVLYFLLTGYHLKQLQDGVINERLQGVLPNLVLGLNQTNRLQIHFSLFNLSIHIARNICRTDNYISLITLKI